MKEKIDNHDPRAKLELRRHFLRRYHADKPASVMDCCAGSGVIWNTLRDEFKVASYWAMDLKSKKGRLAIDSSRVLAQPGWTQDVIDIDTYGRPWKHWLAMLPNVKQPTTVFLTVGFPTTLNPRMVRISNAELDAIGLRFPTLKLPGTFPCYLMELVLQACLMDVERFGVRIVEAVEAVSDGNARYYGARVEPIGDMPAKAR